MKNVVIIPFTLLLFDMFSVIHPALAEERVNVYEMSESGIIIDFPVETTERILFEAVAEKDVSDDSRMQLKR